MWKSNHRAGHSLSLLQHQYSMQKKHYCLTWFADVVCIVRWIWCCIWLTRCDRCVSRPWGLCVFLWPKGQALWGRTLKRSDKGQTLQNFNCISLNQYLKNNVILHGSIFQSLFSCDTIFYSILWLMNLIVRLSILTYQKLITFF